jgi:hypothetical protein
LPTGKKVHPCNHRINACLKFSRLRGQTTQLSSKKLPANLSQILAIASNRIRQSCKERPGLISGQAFKDALSNALQHHW